MVIFLWPLLTYLCFPALLTLLTLLTCGKKKKKQELDSIKPKTEIDEDDQGGDTTVTDASTLASGMSAVDAVLSANNQFDPTQEDISMPVTVPAGKPTTSEKERLAINAAKAAVALAATAAKTAAGPKPDGDKSDKELEPTMAEKLKPKDDDLSLLARECPSLQLGEEAKLDSGAGTPPDDETGLQAGKETSEALSLAPQLSLVLMPDGGNAKKCPAKKPNPPTKTPQSQRSVAVTQAVSSANPDMKTAKKKDPLYDTMFGMQHMPEM